MGVVWDHLRHVDAPTVLLSLLSSLGQQKMTHYSFNIAITKIHARVSCEENYEYIFNLTTSWTDCDCPHVIMPLCVDNMWDFDSCVNYIFKSRTFTFTSFSTFPYYSSSMTKKWFGKSNF